MKRPPLAAALVALAGMTTVVLVVLGHAEGLEARAVDAARRYSEATASPAPTVTVRPKPAPTVTVTVTVTARPERASRSGTRSVWDRLAECESGGDWQINTGNGYGGGLQFSLRYWPFMADLAGVDAAQPWQASKAEQIRVAEVILDRQGWKAWPACSLKLGLR